MNELPLEKIAEKTRSSIFNDFKVILIIPHPNLLKNPGKVKVIIYKFYKVSISKFAMSVVKVIVLYDSLK